MAEADLGHGTEFHFNSSAMGRSIHKHSNYFEIYDRYFEKYKGGAPTILEIGVQHGGSLLMWDAYFGGKANIVGIDILQECKKFEKENIRIFIGDQSDERFLNHVIAEVGPFDVIIDDGSHIPKHQIKSFEVLFFNGLKEDGVYICEDCSTSYWPRFGGGVRRAGTFIEYSKRLCDQVNAWVADNPKLIVDHATKWIKSISFYTAVVVFEKAPMTAPTSVIKPGDEIDLEKPFRKSRLAALIMPLKRSHLVQALVRRNPVLWKLMRSVLDQNQRQP